MGRGNNPIEVQVNSGVIVASPLTTMFYTSLAIGLVGVI